MQDSPIQNIQSSNQQLRYPLDPVSIQILSEFNTAPKIIAGIAQLASGTVTITDGRITPTCVITATSQSSHAVGTGGQSTLAAVCNSGNAVIFASGGVASDVVNYIIVLQ